MRENNLPRPAYKWQLTMARLVGQILLIGLFTWMTVTGMYPGR